MSEEGERWIGAPNNQAPPTFSSSSAQAPNTIEPPVFCELCFNKPLNFYTFTWKWNCCRLTSNKRILQFYIILSMCLCIHKFSEWKYQMANNSWPDAFVIPRINDIFKDYRSTKILVLQTDSFKPPYLVARSWLPLAPPSWRNPKVQPPASRQVFGGCYHGG